MRLFVTPFTDLFAGLQRSTDAIGARALPLLLVACAAGWWLYVPVHELMHAWGAQLGGATVTRLDIDPIYGARFLQRVFPYVQVGSAYAGQLAGFDTHGSDLAYTLTVFFPFLLSIAIGIPLLVRAARAPAPGVASTLLFGFALPIAWAPILSIGGDYYELGAIAVSRAAAMFGVDGESWRGDDVVAIVGRRLGGGAFSWIDPAGVAASLLLGIVLAFVTYAAGRAVASMLARDRRAA
ncbi:MAG TPA: hypothetical protein VHZ01_14900 [Casimicrobiaceae bacterium]|jgi:hypothetical protein|nr:hypothetical protein [Casimicrobiaceae bacterium]